MNDNNDFYEIEDRHCPICGNFVKEGSPSHSCPEEDLKRLFKDDQDEETKGEKAEEDRTLDDKLNEFEEFYNPDNYHDEESDD